MRVAALVCLVLALSACGGNGTHNQSSDAAARWTAGLRHWGAGMTGAINGISVLFSRPSSVRGIQAGNRRTMAKLRTYEVTLAGCAAAVK